MSSVRSAGIFETWRAALQSEFCEVSLSDNAKVRLLDEQVYSLMVNGRSLATAALLPKDLKEFGIGYLVSEGIISYDEIESVMIDKTSIGILTKNPFKVLLPKRSIISGCGGTASYLDPAKLPVLGDGFEISLAKLSAEFSNDMKNFGGFEAASVTQNGEIISDASCLSLFSAFDKMLGKVFLKNCAPENLAVICSGKVTADLIRKSLNAKVSVLASLQPPTALAVKMAEKGRLTVVKLPEGAVYTHKFRILDE